MKKTTIFYWSALPGVGKTSLVIQRMQAHLSKNLPGIIIYVSPTKDLLSQVRTDIEAKIFPKLANKIHTIVSSSSAKKGASRISDTLRNLLLGKPLSDRPKGFQVTSGSVILMTHSGFLTLPDDLPRKHELTIIFDEARKFASPLPKVVLTNLKEEALLSKLLTTNSSHLTLDGENTGFRLLSLDSWPTGLKQITNTSNSRKQYNSLHEVMMAAKNPRVDVYFTKESRSKKKETVFRFYEVIQPSRFFAGYKDVIIIAAFLESSQLWYLLQGKAVSRYISLKPLWEHPDYRNLESKYDQVTKNIKIRFSKLCLFPLTDQTRPLSMTRLDTGIMVPRKDFKEIKRKLEALGCDSTGKLVDLDLGHLATPATPEQKKALRLLDKYGANTDIFSWYMGAALDFIKVLTKEEKIVGDVLAVVNDKKMKQLSSYSTLRRIPVLSNGINTYRENNTLVFAAALNPKPALANLYKALLPDYTFELDHLADSCAQAVTRLCIRDINSDLVAYVIVPDTATAEILKAKLLNGPLISSRAADKNDMVALVTLNPDRKKTLRTVNETKQAVKDAHRKWRDNNKDKIRLFNKRKYLIAKLRAGPNDKYATKLKQVRKEIEELYGKANKGNAS